MYCVDLNNPWLITIIVASCVFFTAILLMLVWFCCYCCYRGNVSDAPSVIRRIVRVKHPPKKVRKFHEQLYDCRYYKTRKFIELLYRRTYADVLPCLVMRDAHFFSHRVVNTWNSLPDSVVLSQSLAGFKRKLKFLDFSCT